MPQLPVTTHHHPGPAALASDLVRNLSAPLGLARQPYCSSVTFFVSPATNDTVPAYPVSKLTPSSAYISISAIRWSPCLVWTTLKTTSQDLRAKRSGQLDVLTA
jgi:hypothetical protein